MQRLLILVLLSVSHNAFAEGPWSFGVAVGAESHDTSHKIQSGTVNLQFNPAESGNSIAASLGYRLHKNWFTTIEYSYFDVDEVDVNNFYATLNYIHPFPDSAYSGYIGVLAGQSELNWQNDPITAADRQSKSEDDFWGAQVGLLMDLNENWRLNLSYRYIETSHGTTLKPLTGSSEFLHEQFHNVSLGIEIQF